LVLVSFYRKITSKTEMKHLLVLTLVFLVHADNITGQGNVFRELCKLSILLVYVVTFLLGT